MEQKNSDQNSVIFSIAEILGKMSNQVNFLIRNDKLMSQLDVDILMENTRKLYDTICSVRCNMDVDAIPMEVTDMNDDKENVDQREDDIVTGVVKEEAYCYFDDDDLEVTIEKDEVLEESKGLETEENDIAFYEEDDDDDDVVEESETTIPIEIEEDNDETVILEDNTGIDDSTSETEGSDDKDATILFEERDKGESDDTIIILDDEDTQDSGIRAYKKVNNEYFTLGDILEQAEDKSLAARLQKNAVTDLTTAIGINDKFLLLNELFSGSMEKYNKSIRALNNFSTYLGAKTYMSELQIEFQWDCESEAYKKLDSLVERRFISIHDA